MTDTSATWMNNILATPRYAPTATKIYSSRSVEAQSQILSHLQLINRPQGENKLRAETCIHKLQGLKIQNIGIWTTESVI